MQDKFYHNDQDPSIQPYGYDWGYIEPSRPGSLHYNPQNHNEISFNPTINIRVDASDQSNREEQHKYSYTIPQQPQRLSRHTGDDVRWQNTFLLMILATVFVAVLGGNKND